MKKDEWKKTVENWNRLEAKIDKNVKLQHELALNLKDVRELVKSSFEHVQLLAIAYLARDVATIERAYPNEEGCSTPYLAHLFTKGDKGLLG